MKIKYFFFAFALTTTTLFSQVSEKTSGVQHFNISRKGSENQKVANDKKSITDSQPPVISVISPQLEADSVFNNTFKTLTVKGKVTDSGGIFEVLVNGAEAKMLFDGTFYAEIPQAFGKNLILIKATDVSHNSSIVKFFSDRLTDIAKPVEVTGKGSEKGHIYVEFISPGTDYSITADDKIGLQACLRSPVTVTRIMIYRNNSFINGYLKDQIISSEGCDFKINTPVPLTLGINDIRIEIYTGADTIRRNITVEYSFYAARNFALLIGNEQYDDPAILNLTEPLHDIDELYNTLTRDYNFDQQNVIMLKNSTKAEIIGTLHQLRSRINPIDNLLIFYAGHGYWDEGMGVGYWLPKDAAINNPVNWIPNTDLTNYLGAIKTKHTLLIADACFSGGIFKTTRSVNSNSYAVEKLYQLPSRKAITSGTMTVVPDRSAFFQYLIKNLTENRNDYLPAEELFMNMRMAVINNSDIVPQFGTIQNAGDEGGDFIFIRRRK
jgi:hypothetical protein